MMVAMVRMVMMMMMMRMMRVTVSTTIIKACTPTQIYS